MKEESRCGKKRAANIFERLGLEAQEVKERLKMKTMMVRSYVELTVPAGDRHLKVAREAAEGMTTDKSAVSVEVPPDEPNGRYDIPDGSGAADGLSRSVRCRSLLSTRCCMIQSSRSEWRTPVFL